MRLSIRRSPYRELEDRLGYAFRHRVLLETALTHPSYRFETPGVREDNQRLEFLGDAVLGLVSATHIFETHKDQAEGVLTDLRSRVTSGRALAAIARAIDVGRFVRLGKGEERSGGRQRPTLLADALEAVIGAAYLDGGLRAVERIYRRLFVPRLEAGEQEAWLENPKGRLQELAQQMFHRDPVYRTIGEEGPPHRRTFTVEARVNDAPLGWGSGRNRRQAESAAAAQAVRALLTQRHPGAHRSPD